MGIQTHEVAESDTRLVRECLKGNEEAWSSLIDKYKNLIYSIPVKYGFPREEANEIFQSVCLELVTGLANLREPQALAKWLIQVTAHKCLRWQRIAERTVTTDQQVFDGLPDEHGELFPEVIAQAESEQFIREALSELPPRCSELIHMLFFETPPRPYKEVAESLGIATGSIGFIRQRCLNRLRKRLEELGY